MIKIKNLIKNFMDYFFEDKIVKFFSEKVKNNICIDVGAAKFEHLPWKTFLLSENTKWIAIDPNKQSLDYLKFWRWKAKLFEENTAVSQNGGEMNLYVTNVPTGSSLKKINIDQNLKNRVDLNYFYPVKEEKIQTASIQNLLEKYYDNNFDIFIKIDIQGYGMEILKGLETYFKSNKILGIEIECSLLSDPPYENASKFNDISIFLEKFNFELIHLNVINFKKNSKKNKYIPNECDAVFSMKQNKVKNTDSKINLLCFYNCYQLFDEIKSYYENDDELKKELFKHHRSGSLKKILKI